jgi:hypothetical protein
MAAARSRLRAYPFADWLAAMREGKPLPPPRSVIIGHDFVMAAGNRGPTGHLTFDETRMEHHRAVHVRPYDGRKP